MPGGGRPRSETPWARCGLRSSEPGDQRLAVGVVAVALEDFHELDSVIEALDGFCSGVGGNLDVNLGDSLIANNSSTIWQPICERYVTHLEEGKHALRIRFDYAALLTHTHR